MDIAISVALAILTIAMAYLGVYVTLHPPNESPRAKRPYKVAFLACAILAVALVWIQSVRARTAQRESTKRITGLETTLSSVRNDLASVETATSLLRTEQAAETARRQQAEKDLAIIVQSSGKAVREGVVSDIRKAPITVQVNGQPTAQPLTVEELKLFSEPENSSHKDAPYALKITLQATAPINPLRVAIRCASEIKYVEMGYPSGLGEGMMWYGGVEVYKNDHTIVIVNMTGNAKAPISPDLPLLLHVAAAEPIVIKSFERGPK